MIHDNNSTWIEISQSAYYHNISHIKSIIGARKLAVVIKANAYGHGLLEIASLAENNQCIEWLCVASASEALNLRAAGITKPILIMGNVDTDPKYLVNANIHLAIDTLDMAQRLDVIGKEHTYIFPIHIKVDTGLSRFGIIPDKVIQFVREIKKKKYVALHGMYSHLSEADKPDKTFTDIQISRFRSVLKELADHNISVPLIHLANSAATTTIDLPFCTLFRVGIEGYGLWPSLTTKQETLIRHPHFLLKPILTWKSRIISIKTVPKDSFVGYCRNFTAQRNTIVAVIASGYYDGYDMRFSNNSIVLIRNQYAPVIGRVAMNTTFIDITDITPVQVGAEVILLGDYPGILPYDLSSRIQNPNVRELITTINPRIPRVLVP